ncbi:MAG: LysR family transcriptional regulator [Phascolarctobacterium sp.]|nr:LysR family transcriptional regulator [Phascolarctobacterium sp.]
MDIHVLRYFLAVAREGNVTKAADFLHLTQPTLSRQMAQLEEEAGIQLFIKEPRHWGLTEQGMLLRRRAQELVELMDKTQQELLDKENAIKGKVSICCGEHEAVKILAKMFKAFNELYPEVTFEIYTATSEYAKERIGIGLADFGIFSEPYENVEQYDYLYLGETEEWVVLMRANDPYADKESITPEDLVDKKLIFPWRSKVKSTLRNWLGTAFADKNIIMSSNFRTNAAFMVAEGLGYFLNMYVSSHGYLDDKLVSKPLNPPLKSKTSLVWLKHKPLTPTADRFLEFARKYMDKEQATNMRVD